MNGRRWAAALTAIGVFLLGELLVAVWWAATVNTKLEIIGDNQTAIIAGTKDRYTGNDADMDWEQERTKDERDWEQQHRKDERQDDRINKLHTDGKD